MVTWLGIAEASFHPRIEPEIRVDHPVLSPDGRALWNAPAEEAWVWVMPETDEGSFYCYLDAEGPVPPWFRYIDNTEGFHSALFPDVFDGAGLAKVLMEMGVAPDQPFFIHMWFEYHQGDGWETEDEAILEWELLDVEPLDPTKAAKRWAMWLEDERKR